MTIKEIWSIEQHDQRVFNILEKWQRGLDLGKKVKRAPFGENSTESEHKTEALIRKFCKKVDNQNANVGLTSSDMEENERTMAIEETLGYLHGRINNELIPLVRTAFTGMDADRVVMGYTHLMKARPIKAKHRADYHVYQFTVIEPPRIIYRGIKGSTGDGKYCDSVCHTNNVNASLFKAQIETTASQTSTHVTDIEFAVWLASITAAMMKTAGSLRMLISMGKIRTTNNDVGSTAMAHKAPNPWRFEKVCGMGGLVLSLPQVAFRAVADCWLERTLTDQSVLRYEMERMSVLVDDLITLMVDGIKRIEVIEDASDEIDKEGQFLNAILAGSPRLEARELIK